MEATIDAYHTDVADLVKAYTPRPVEELLPGDIAEYLQSRAVHEGWAAPTVRRMAMSERLSFTTITSVEMMLKAPIKTINSKTKK